MYSGGVELGCAFAVAGSECVLSESSLLSCKSNHSKCVDVQGETREKITIYAAS